MIFPVGTKTNTRYRGPLESKKTDSFNREQYTNIQTLYTTISGFESDIQTMFENIDSAERIDIGLKLNKMNNTILNPGSTTLVSPLQVKIGKLKIGTFKIGQTI